MFAVPTDGSALSTTSLAVHLHSIKRRTSSSLTIYSSNADRGTASLTMIYQRLDSVKFDNLGFIITGDVR